MILYIIRFSVSLTIIYVFYRVFLEREKTHSFNRYFLLFGIFISLLIPLISINGSEEIKSVISNVQPKIENSLPHWEVLIVYAYLFITSILLVRFAFDIYSLIRIIRYSDQHHINKARLVLTDEPTTPYSFLNYVFINKNHFKAIQPELLRHELTHVVQLHTLDVFIIELLRIFFWINPLLNWYKKSMQLNHEFLADHHVIATHQNVQNYQKILLTYLGKTVPASITSSLNFSLTRKRFSMMTKKKNKKQLIKQLLVIPVVILILLACSDNKGVSGKEMLLYWRFTANMEEILMTGTMNESDLKEGIIKPIETKEQYNKIMDIYNRMNKSQKESVYKLPPYLEPIDNP